MSWSTYDEALQQVFVDEGGYSNDRGDPGGPTKYGITIHDARSYWKHDATAHDVANMPKPVAEDIYKKHYAEPIHYGDLPAGVDYAVLDYGINSGIHRALRVYNTYKKHTPVDVINDIYDERLHFLRSLHTWSLFGKGWKRRCDNGRKLALHLHTKYGEPHGDNQTS